MTRNTHFFNYLFDKYLLILYYVLGAFLGTEDTAMENSLKSLPCGAHILVGETVLVEISEIHSILDKVQKGGREVVILDH